MCGPTQNAKAKDDEDKYDDDLKALEANQSPPNKKSQRKPADTGKESDGDNYSSDGSDNKMILTQRSDTTHFRRVSE